MAGFLRRHSSEQYLTSAQVFAHRFRQVIARPHTSQGLLGRNCLFPLKLGIVPVIYRVCAGGGAEDGSRPHRPIIRRKTSR